MTEPKPPANPREKLFDIAAQLQEAMQSLESAADDLGETESFDFIKAARSNLDSVERMLTELEQQVAGVAGSVKR